MTEFTHDNFHLCCLSVDFKGPTIPLWKDRQFLQKFVLGLFTLIASVITCLGVVTAAYISKNNRNEQSNTGNNGSSSQEQTQPTEQQNKPSPNTPQAVSSSNQPTASQQQAAPSPQEPVETRILQQEASQQGAGASSSVTARTERGSNIDLITISTPSEQKIISTDTKPNLSETTTRIKSPASTTLTTGRKRQSHSNTGSYKSAVSGQSKHKSSKRRSTKSPKNIATINMH